MEDTIVLFGIVPVVNENSFVCKNENGRHYYKHKKYMSEERLVFDSEDAALNYIDKYLSDKVYRTQLFICDNKENLPFKIL